MGAGALVKTDPAIKIPDPETLFDGTSTLWHADVGGLLAQAAILSVEHGLDGDTFMKGAWSAYVEARPGMREHLEQVKLVVELANARKHGRTGKA